MKDDISEGEEGEDDEPEPEEDVDLLVDDVEGEHAQAVVPGDGAARSVLVEGALGHLGCTISKTFIRLPEL